MFDPFEAVRPPVLATEEPETIIQIVEVPAPIVLIFGIDEKIFTGILIGIFIMFILEEF